MTTPNKLFKFLTLAACIAASTLSLSCAFRKAEMGIVSRDSGGNDGFSKNPGSEKVVKDIIRHDYKPGQVTELCEQSLARLNLRLEGEVKDAYQFDLVLADASDELSPLTFMGYVHTQEKIRAEGSACEEKYSQAMVDIFSRRNLYEAVKSTVAKTPDQLRIVSEFKRQFEKNGMSLSDANLAKVKELKSKLAALEAQFAKNLNEDKSAVAFTKAELEGLSESFINRLNKDSTDKYIVTTKSTDFTEVMDNAKNPNTRKRILTAYDNRVATANTKLIEEALLLRQQIKSLMGFKNWPDYRIDGRMAKNSENVMTLLLDLKKKLRPRLQADLKILLDAKKSLENKKAKTLEAWDIRYFENQVKKRDYSLDNEVIREYFPKDTVMKGMFEVYSTLFGVKYEEVKNASVWSNDAKLYVIREKSNNDIVGYFYADFVPREGKYGHAAAFPLIAGRMIQNKYYSLPVASIVANFTPPANGKPSLLTHREVETLFHEFGHIMHQTLTKAPYAFLSGSATAQDFVEAPSQMLEGWVWETEILNKISGHYTDVSKKLPAEIIEKMLAAKDFNQGYFYSRQLMLGLTDMTMHLAEGPVDVTKIYRDVHKDVLLVAPVKTSHFVASFGHLMGGYDAGYYGYIWSEVFADDMYTIFQRDGILSAATGSRYRATILEDGNMVDPNELLTSFLGRAPNNEAFLKKLGL